MRNRVRALLAVLALAGLLLGVIVGPALAQSATIVKFEGLVGSRPAGDVGDWEIDGKAVESVESTVVDAGIETGDLVSVVAKEYDDGSLEAMIIRLEEQQNGQGEARLHITGYVSEYVEGDYLIVNGQRIEIDQDTVITEDEGPLEEGAFAAVMAVREDGKWVATDVTVADITARVFEIIGVLDELTETSCMVDGREIEIPDPVVVHGDVEVGDTVRARVREQEDGTLVAILITLDNGNEWSGMFGPGFQPTFVVYEGILESKGEGWLGWDVWTLDDGSELYVGMGTQLPDGVPDVGDQVKVTTLEGIADKLFAIVVEIEDGDGAPPVGGNLHLAGFISEVGADYIVVNGFTIYIDESTEVKGELGADRLAFVMAQEAEGRWVASDIRVTTWGSPS